MSNTLLTTIAGIMIGLDVLLVIILALQVLQPHNNNWANFLAILFGGLVVGGIGFGIYKLVDWVLGWNFHSKMFNGLKVWFEQYGLSMTVLMLSVFVFFFLLVTITHQDELMEYFKARRALQNG